MVPFCLFVTFSLILMTGITTSSTHVHHRIEPDTQNVYFIHPDGDNTSCPKIDNQTVCENLAFYTGQSETYFKSYTTFQFLDGYFQHNTNFSVANISDLRMRGCVGNSTIECSGSNPGFAFDNVTRLTIENLTFLKCGQLLDYGFGPTETALACSYGRDHTLSGIKVLYSENQNIHYNNVEGNTTIKNSMFAHAVDSNSSDFAGNSFFFTDCDQSTQFLIMNTQLLNNTNRKDNKNTNGQPHAVDFASGLLITLKCTTVNVTLDSVTLDGNLGHSGGNLAVVFYNLSSVFTSPFVIQNSLVTNGIATVGGGLFSTLVEASTSMYSYNCTPTATPRTLLKIKNTTFVGNRARWGGGAIYLQPKESQTYCSVAKIEIQNCTFRNNSINKQGLGGVAIHNMNFIALKYLPHGNPQFHLEVNNSHFFDHNVDSPSGKGVIFAKTSPHVILNNVSIHDNTCSGILGIGTNFIMSGNVDISNNTGSSGGGILFCSDSAMFFTAHTNLTIAHNHAKHAGGGICVDKECLQSKPMCFFQLGLESFMHPELIHTISVHLINNTAGYAGGGLYGGSVEYCYLLDTPLHNVTANESLPVFNVLFKLEHSPENRYSYITSPPQRVCLCNETDWCNLPNHPVLVYPGETFPLSLVIVGQLNGTVPGAIEGSIAKESDYQLDRHERLQSTRGKHCNRLYYTVRTDKPKAKLTLKAEVIGDRSFADRLKKYGSLHVYVHLEDCPVGFQLVEHGQSGYSCDCIEAVRHGDIKCNITNKTLMYTHHKEIWIGYENETNTYFFSHGVAFDYSVLTGTTTIQVTDDSMDQDAQCQHNRTGILCGACPVGYSVILGSSMCQNDCSNKYLSLILFFAMAGVILVFLLTILNLTVAEGTVSGLIFYVNIVKIHWAVFFGQQQVPVLTTSLFVFVSWINLDLGIPVCFYQGMDEYGKAWLQFLFPLYVWVISGVIIFLSRFSNSFAKLFGSNGVKVLATFILLSYSKLLRAIISAFQFKEVLHYNGSEFDGVSVYHWKPDANLQYLQGKHIPLFAFGVIFLVICLPFTLTLLCLHILNKVSNRRCFTWVWRLKPFFDAYTGPYSKCARFWTGLLLLVRVILLIIILSALNYAGVEVVNIFATIVACIILLVIEWALRHGIYEKRAFDVLECTFLFNLSFICTGTTYAIYGDHPTTQSAFAHTSVLIAFLTFLGIIGYHGYKRITQVCKRRKQTSSTMV